MTGTLLASCVAAVLVMLVLPRLDTALWIALGAFALDIPFLVVTFIVALQSPELQLGNSWNAGYSAGVETVLSYSFIPVPVAFSAILWHFSPIIWGIFAMSTIAAVVLFAFSTDTFDRLHPTQLAKDIELH